MARPGKSTPDRYNQAIRVCGVARLSRVAEYRRCPAPLWGEGNRREGRQVVSAQPPVQALSDTTRTAALSHHWICLRALR